MTRDPVVVSRARAAQWGPKTKAEMLVDLVDRSGGPDACWPWTGSRSPEGYGRYGGVKGHRAALERVLGRALRPGEFACHRCDNKACCNPAHLYVGDRLTNARDHKERGVPSPITLPKTHCAKGHEMTGGNVLTWTRGRRCRTCRRDYLERTTKTPEYRAKEAARSRYARLAAATSPDEPETASPGPLLIGGSRRIGSPGAPGSE